MRVAFNDSDGKLYPLRRRVELEEDEIVGEDASPDLVVSREVKEVGVPTFGITTELPALALGYSLTEKEGYDYFLTKIFDEDWGEGVFLGIPIRGLMNEDCGAQVTSACWVKGIDSGYLESFFKCGHLENTLRHMKFTGPVSILFNSYDRKVTSVMTGMPTLGFYALAENIKGKISEFGVAPCGVLVRKSWGLAALFSRYPYPFQVQTTEAPLHGLALSVERHFWVARGKRYKGVFYTRETGMGVASAWGHSTGVASSRVLRTCRALHVPDRQYRTDYFLSLDRKEEAFQEILKESLGNEMS